MDKQQKLKIALPVLAVVMAFVWGPVITGSGSKPKSASHTGTVAALQGGGAELMALARSNERKKARTSYTDWGRNPFTLAESPEASVLEGILWDVKDPKVIISGEILGVGDKTGSGEIVDIQSNSVTINDGSGEKVFSLGQ
ncbi:MAG: hypothetical protein KAS92_07820 [Candidatus Omnitrophica bacterium]|nr:hypothetical protein [Candidatus Omnitrophota bacterium]